jgi:hypothetical protein
MILTAAACLTLAGLACNLNVGGPTPPGSPIPVSTEAAGQLRELWKSALENSGGGDVSVIVTEEQLTSYLAFRLAEQPDPPLRDVQVYLRDSKIQIYGTAQAGNLTTTALVSLAVSISPEGQASFSVEQADFGPVPVPSALLEKLSTGLNEAFTGQVGSLATGFKIKSVLIADGQMGIIGTVTK